MPNNNKSFCLDPSCFASLTVLRDTLKVVEEVCINDYELFVPTDIFDTIMLEPNEKFRKLPVIIQDWLEHDNKDITKLSEIEKNEYMNKCDYYYNTI